MTRVEFVAVLKRHELGWPWQVDGVGAGLPLELSEALHIADVMREMRIGAPSSAEICQWYGRSDVASEDPPALRACDSLVQLYVNNLATMDIGQLQFAVRCTNWARIVRNTFHECSRSIADSPCGLPAQ